MAAIHTSEWMMVIWFGLFVVSRLTIDGRCTNYLLTDVVPSNMDSTVTIRENTDKCFANI